MKYLKSYNESLRDKMKPKSDEDILKDLGNLTPNELLIKSTENNYLNGVKIALERGADVNIKENQGFVNSALKDDTALILASYRGNKEIVELLLKYGADVNYINKNGNSLLEIAIVNNYREIVELLIKNGADINLNDEHLKKLSSKKYKYIKELIKKYPKE